MAKPIPSIYRQAVDKLVLAVRQACLRSRNHQISSERFAMLVRRYGLVAKIPTSGDYIVNRQMRSGATHLIEVWRRKVRRILRRNHNQELLKLPQLPIYRLIDCGKHDVEKIKRVPRKAKNESINHTKRLTRDVIKGKTRVTTIKKLNSEIPVMAKAHDEAIVKIEQLVLRL